MLRLLVVFTFILALMSATSQTAAQEEEPCPAVEWALAATPGASPAAYPASSPTTSPTTEPNGSPTGSPTVTMTASPTAEGCTVEVSGFAFNPPNITIAVGTTVTWTNKDVGIPHTATADDQDPATGQPFFDIDLPDENESGSHTFNTAGEFPYHCDIHPFMKGSVQVT